MNRKEKIKEAKTHLRELENSEQVLKQSLAVITKSKEKLQLELVSLGAANSTRTGKFDNILSESAKSSLIGGLTK